MGKGVKMGKTAKKYRTKLLIDDRLAGDKQIAKLVEQGHEVDFMDFSGFDGVIAMNAWRYVEGFIPLTIRGIRAAKTGKQEVETEGS